MTSYYFLAPPGRFGRRSSLGTALEFMLDSGKADYAPIAALPELAALRRKEAADTGARPWSGPPTLEVEVWSTSLRFSSISDVLAARPGAR
jgi:hypothetical protein